MKIKYFEDSDTTLVELSDHAVSETKEINENIYIDLDEQGQLVNMTIEHASSQADMQEFAFQRISTEGWYSAYQEKLFGAGGTGAVDVAAISYLSDNQLSGVMPPQLMLLASLKLDKKVEKGVKKGTEGIIIG